METGNGFKGARKDLSFSLWLLLLHRSDEHDLKTFLVPSFRCFLENLLSIVLRALPCRQCALMA